MGCVCVNDRKKIYTSTASELLKKVLISLGEEDFGAANSTSLKITLQQQRKKKQKNNRTRNNKYIQEQ